LRRYMEIEFIEVIKAILIGTVEGITEWLPISSTGHMILLDEFLKLDVTEEFMEMFRVVIQSGAILAVVLLFFKKLWPFSSKEKYFLKKDTWTLWFKIMVACIPAMLVSVFDDAIDEMFMNPVTVVITLVFYGIVFIIIENMNKKAETDDLHLNGASSSVKKEKVTDMAGITFKLALLVGLFQVLAVIPGTSRSGATIIGGLMLGMSRATAAEFTFYLAIPVMMGASLLKIVKFGFNFNSAEITILLTGMMVAFAVSVVAIRFLMNYVKKHDFKVFGYYRIALGVLVGGYFLFRAIS